MNEKAFFTTNVNNRKTHKNGTHVWIGLWNRASSLILLKVENNICCGLWEAHSNAVELAVITLNQNGRETIYLTSAVLLLSRGHCVVDVLSHSLQARTSRHTLTHAVFTTSNTTHDLRESHHTRGVPPGRQITRVKDKDTEASCWVTTF